MQEFINVKIIEFDKILYNDVALDVVVNATTGKYQFQPEHKDFISVIKNGKAKINQKKGDPIIFDYKDGLVTCKNNLLTILIYE